MKGKYKSIAKIVLLPLLTLVCIFFFSKFNISPALSWYNASWLYRRPVDVANPGSTLTNEDVLIVLDTQSLVSGGKLQTDCDDIRVIDSDDTTPISYWIEGGCNTTTTHIWARIPSLASGGETIYVYYANSSATNSEQTWTGRFYIMKDATCDSGWATESSSGGDFYQRFPYPGSTHGTTGGSSSHNHGNYNPTVSTVSTGANTNTNAGNGISGAHNHSLTLVTEDNTSVLPPYLDMIFCSNNDLVIKPNSITEFTSTVPGGFTRFSALDNLFPRGNSSYGGTSTTTTHTHVITAATTGAPSNSQTCGAGATATASSTHTHDFATTATGNGTQLPTYMEVIYGESESASADVMAPAGMITMSNDTPPLGWTRFSALDGYFTYGATTYGTTGGAATHNHSIGVLTSGAMSSSVNCATTTPRSSLPRAHTHDTTSTNTSDYSNDPPYIQTLFIQKKTSQSTTVNAEEAPGVPPNAPSSLLTEGATNPTGVTDLTPEFSAIFSDNNAGDTGDYYEIEVNTNDTFTGTVMWDTGQTATGPITNGARSPDYSYAGTSLTTNGTIYYWRIKFWDNTGQASNWSSTANFTMNTTPSAPTLPLTEGATDPIGVADLTPEFSAIFNDSDTGDTGNYYQVEVNTNNSFTGTVMWDSGLLSMTPTAIGARSPDISYAGTALSTNGTTYYWRIKFADNHGTVGPVSSTAQFTMNNAPGAPTVPLVEGGTDPTRIDDLTPEFSAIFNDSDTGDTGNYYEIDVNTTSDFNGTVMWASGLQAMTPTAIGARSPDIAYAGTALSANRIKYYWRIRFADDQGTVGSWSATGNFTMIGSGNVTFEKVTLEKMVVDPY